MIDLSRCGSENEAAWMEGVTLYIYLPGECIIEHLSAPSNGRKSQTLSAPKSGHPRSSLGHPRSPDMVSVYRQAFSVVAGSTV